MAFIPPEPIGHLGAPTHYSLQNLMELIHRARQGGLSENLHTPLGHSHLHDGQGNGLVGHPHPLVARSAQSGPVRQALGLGLHGETLQPHPQLHLPERLAPGLLPGMGAPSPGTHFGPDGGPSNYPGIPVDVAQGFRVPPPPPRPIGGVPGPAHVMAARAALAGYA